MTITEQPATAAAESDWSAADLAARLASQRLAQRLAGPPSLAVRRDRLDRLAAVLADHGDAIVRAISADFGNRPLAAAMAGEVLLQLQEISTTKRHLTAWAKARHPQPGYLRLAGLKAWVEPTPLGVVGIIAPWNFPIALAVQPAIAALAAGNRVMIKMSELTPRTAAALARAVAERFDPDELVVVTGGPEIGAAFSALPLDHLFFTGSPGVARHVQRAAAEHLTPVTLELGGKNPTVVGRDADLADAAKRIVRARLANSGQICLSPDYVFVPRELESAFVAAAQDACRTALPTVLGNPDYCQIINDAHYRRIVGLVEDARALGADVVEVVPAGEQLPSAATRRIPFTMLRRVTPQMRVLDEEIFGPVLPVLPYDSVDEVIAHVEDRPSPLAAYWFGGDSADFRRFAARTRSGGVSRNDFALHAALEGLPFGGIGNSGTGYYHGQYGFETFSHLRAFAVSLDSFSPVSLLSPPFSPKLETAMRGALRLQRKLSGRRLRKASTTTTEERAR